MSARGSLTLWPEESGDLMGRIAEAWAADLPVTITSEDGAERAVRITRAVYNEEAQYLYAEWEEVTGA